jgi:hypothetical protein
MSYYDKDKANAQPSMKWPKPHHGSVPEYAVSGWPCMKSGTATGLSTPNTIEFEYVTRWIQITNTGTSALAVSFADPADATPTGVPKTYYTVQAGKVSPRLELKCVKLYINTLNPTTPATYSILAGLTAIQADGFPDISGLSGVSHT